MSRTITLPNWRATSDGTVRVRLKDGGVAIDWSGLTGIKAWLYSDVQKAIAGRFDVSVSQEDPTILRCDYSARKPQYLGPNRIIVQARYMGRTKTYDKPAMNIVARTAELTGQEVTMEDPIVDVEIEVEDVTSSILDAVLEACIQATEEAKDVVDVHRGPRGYSAYEVAVQDGFEGTEDEWLESLHGKDGKQGPQGNPGSSQDYPFELVNNRKTNDPDKALTAAEGMRIGDDIEILQEKTGAIELTKNIFLLSDFPKYEGITVDDGVVSGSASNFHLAFGGNRYYPLYSRPIKENTQYTISCKGWTEGNESSETSLGLELRFVYSDGTIESALIFKNNDTSEVFKFGVSDAGKTLVGIGISYVTSGSNIWHLRELQLEEGASATGFIEPYTCKDQNAREEHYAHEAAVFCTEEALNQQILLLHIENEQAAREDGLFVYVIDPEYSVIYFGVPGNNTAIMFADIVPGTIQERQYDTYGKISISVKKDWEYSRSSALSYNIGGLAYQNILDIVIDTVRQLPAVSPYDKITVPSECIEEFDSIPVFPEIEYNEIRRVSDEAGLSDAVTSGTPALIILESDVLANNLTPGADKIIIGNGNRLCGYDRRFNGGVQSGAFRRYPLSGLVPTSNDTPQPYYFDDNKQVVQYKTSRWFDSPGHVTMADGSETDPGQTGQHRVQVPHNFGYSAADLLGAYIQWFGWFTSWVAKIDSFDGVYIYFTVGNQYPGGNPGGDYNPGGNNASFRIYNLRSNSHVFFDDEYLYVPEFINNLYLSGLAMDTGAHHVEMSRLTIIGHVTGRLYIHDSSVRYMNGCIELEGDVARLEDVVISKAMGVAIDCGASFNHVLHCDISQTCENCTNSYSIGVRKSGISALIEKNKISDFGYSTMYIGGCDEAPSYVPPKTIVQDNIIFQTERYDGYHCVAFDSGAIYVSAWNNKSNIGAIIRRNVIHDYMSRGDGRGIFCDGGACYVCVYSNHVTRIKRGTCIDMYYATGRVGPTGYMDNNGKFLIGNKVDGPCVFCVGANSIEKVSVMANNIRIYGDQWDTKDTVRVLDESALRQIKDTAIDQFGYTDENGRIVSKFD